MKSEAVHSIAEEARLKAIFLTKGIEILKSEIERFEQYPMQ